MSRRGLLVLAWAASALLATPPTVAGDDTRPLPPPRHLRGGQPVEGVPVPPASRPVPAARPADGPPARPAPPAPPAPPEPPKSPLPPLPSWTQFKIEGRVTPFPVPGDEDTVAVVMAGNAEVRDPRFSVKAKTIVVWIDRRKAPGLISGVGGKGGSGKPARPGSEQAGQEPRAPEPPASESGTKHESAVPEAILALYAEGAIEISSGQLTFRGEEVYVDPRKAIGLVLKPRFSGRVTVAGASDPIPFEVRAERARILSQGFAAFSDAEIAVARASDRIALEVRTVTLEEMAPRGAEPDFVGFATTKGGRQRIHAQSLVARVERVPVLAWPDVAFGGGEEFPVKSSPLGFGSRSSLGWYGFARVGDRVSGGPDPKAPDRFLDWAVDFGGYTKRGPAVAGELAWSAAPADRTERLTGLFRPYAVWDDTGDDRTGFDAGSGVRWLETFENRWDLAPGWRLDVEANAFSDRGVYREFFEVESKNHKDRETYARLRWMRGGFGATLTGGIRLRDFMTETERKPELGIWSESVPLLPATSPLALDLSTVASVGLLARRFDEDLPDPDYEAVRADVTTRLYSPFDVGDVRVSPFVGVRHTAWTERTDGGPDVSRTAFEAGARANLQLHRDYDVVGGPWSLDGLRHVIDIDAEGFLSRSDDDPADRPFFDRVDSERDWSRVSLSVRNRLETRRVLERSPVPGDRLRVNASLVDVLARVSWWPDGVGAYGEKGDGEATLRASGELAPDRLYVRTEARASLMDLELEHGSFGIEAYPCESLDLATGVRYVRGESLAPWFAVYHRWAEKWAVSAAGLYDSERHASTRFSVSILRISEDHVFEVGAKMRDDFDDFGVFVNFGLAIGGVPVSDPFAPKDDVDIGP